MMQRSTAPDIAQVIQQGVAPVFLLSGIAAMLSVLTSRPGRGIDRARQFAGLFIVAMLALVGGLIRFLREIFVATASVRIDPPQVRVITVRPELP